MQYKEPQSRYRIIGYGGIYDFSSNTVKPSPELDLRFYPIRHCVADWLGIERREIERLLVTECVPGTQLGWHRDVLHYETIVGISLGRTATLGFRSYPLTAATNRQSVKLEAAPRSIYRFQGVARWEWQHSVPPVQAERWSITLRTKRSTKRFLSE
ncbi:MAG: alpha-ketoglutarate-dependent dioxygenase AlkB [Lautropia sp.]|nr:alpha-ketoglutarate-dependent dioxygenase AlkB [Lautropia sp.]